MELFKYPYLCGMYLRNRKIFDCYSFLKQSETWDRKTLRDFQLTKLKDLLTAAYDNSPYYRAKFDSYGFKPSSVQSLQDMQKIPVTTKEEVLAHSKEIQVWDRSEKLVFSETSGSTGRPLVFYRGQEWDAWHNASVLRGYSWHGVHPWERNGYLWGYNIAPKKRLKVKVLDFLQNRFRLFAYGEDKVDAFVSKLEGARYLEGYSSMLYEIAKKVNSRGESRKFDLKMIKGTSEKIYDTYHKEVEKAFGKKIISEYGSAEGGIIAFECVHGNMHMNMETVIAEVMDGEILVTNLVSKSFPIIRYRLGDYVTTDEETKCRCGMAHPIIKEVTGRVGAVIHGNRESYPSLTLYYVFKNLALEKGVVYNYQIIQEQKGRIKALIENSLDDTEADVLKAEFRKYYSDDVAVELITNVKRSDFDSKKKDFVSYIQ